MQGHKVTRWGQLPQFSQFLVTDGTIKHVFLDKLRESQSTINCRYERICYDWW